MYEYLERPEPLITREKLRTAAIVFAFMCVSAVGIMVWSTLQTRALHDEIERTRYHQYMPEGWEYVDEQATSFRVRTSPLSEINVCAVGPEYPKGIMPDEGLFAWATPLPKNLIYVEYIEPPYNLQTCRRVRSARFILTLSKLH